MKTCIFCGNEIKGRGQLYCGRDCSNKHRRIKERQDRKTYTVWSCGGGVQSTAMAALIYTGKIPKPDYAIMVDTGFEKSDVMDYVRNIIIPHMAEVGVELNIIRTSDYVEQSIIDDEGFCVIPVFKKQVDGGQRLRTYCNHNWKIKVIRKWLLKNGVEQYRSLIGISTDEAHRQRKPHKKYYENIYPLIELGFDRDDCINYITSIGWPEPLRSSCYICGQQDDGAWWRMRIKCPEDFKRAVEAEQYLQTYDGSIFLHRSCRPLDEVFKI